MTSATDQDAAPDVALALVHEGWNHLQLQRPLAAWASWQRALRCVDDHPAARHALVALESAGELPAAARASYRFEAPLDPARRARWDRCLEGRDLEQLEAAAAAFAALAADDPADASAAFNEGLCLAWLGRNAESIAALDRAMHVLAAESFDRAVADWTLAEVLRQGAGAEPLADDLRYVWIIEDVDAGALTRLAREATLVSVPLPLDPIDSPTLPHAEIFEWLDRPLPAPDEGPLTTADLPRLQATLVRTPQSLRLSSPDPLTLDALHEPLRRILGDFEPTLTREATPLPWPLLDAAVWTFRLPRGLDRASEIQLTRSAVETYFEDRWIHVPRAGLEGHTPFEAARRASDNALIRAKLTAVIRVREQLGARPRTAQLYLGYPFDRLRRRLGLDPIDPATIDPEDSTCMSAAELDRLDPAGLDDVRLTDAFESAAGLREDGRTVRFAAALARRPEPGRTLSRLDLAALFAPLVRASMSAHQPDEALAWLDRARAVANGQQRHLRTFDIWCAEVHARRGHAAAARRTYESILQRTPSDAALALDAAETLLDNGHREDARPLLLHAREQGQQAGDTHIVERAQAFLEEICS